MKSKFYVVCIFVAIMMFCACEGAKGPAGSQGPTGGYDKQIEISFDPFVFIITSDTSWVMPFSTTYLLYFNKNNYVDVDSIIFLANMGSSASNTYCNVELYNVTSNVPISGSLITTNNTTLFPGMSYGGVWVQSGNIFNALPETDITLTLRVKSTKQGTNVNINRARMLLYR